MRARTEDTTVFTSMGGGLRVVAYPDRRCTIRYKNYLWELPRDLDKIFDDLVDVLPRDTAEIVYEKINDEIDAAMDYAGCIPFDLPVADNRHTVAPLQRNSEGYYIWSYDDAMSYNNIMSGAASVESPNVWYITAEDFENKRRSGQLSHNTMYLVFNQ